MSLAVISPQDAKLLFEKGALLVDVRGPDEYAAEHIEKSLNVPIPQLRQGNVGEGDRAIVYLCKSGMRTKMNASALENAAKADAFIMSGGIEGWKSAGYSVHRGEKSSAGMVSRLAKFFG